MRVDTRFFSYLFHVDWWLYARVPPKSRSMASTLILLIQIVPLVITVMLLRWVRMVSVLGVFTCFGSVWWEMSAIAFIKESLPLYSRGSVLYSSVRQRHNATHIEAIKN